MLGLELVEGPVPLALGVLEHVCLVDDHVVEPKAPQEVPVLAPFRLKVRHGRQDDVQPRGGIRRLAARTNRAARARK